MLKGMTNANDINNIWYIYLVKHHIDKTSKHDKNKNSKERKSSIQLKSVSLAKIYKKRNKK